MCTAIASLNLGLRSFEWLTDRNARSTTAAAAAAAATAAPSGTASTQITSPETKATAGAH